MRIFKTDNLKIVIEVNDITPNLSIKPAKLLSVKVNDSDCATIQLSEPLTKSQVTDNALSRHILNFFIKE